MDTYEKKLIADVLHNAHLASLPKKADPEKTIWIEAIAKIRLSDNSFGYGIVKRNADLSYRVSYINGHTATIVKVEEVYPYIRLDKSNIRKFADKDDKDGRVAYLKSLNLPYAVSTDFDKMEIDELNKEVVKAAVYQQIKALEE